MLGKLMKYEFKACGRTFIPLYIGILVLSAINGLCANYTIFETGADGSNPNSSMINMQSILILILFALFVALFVITIVLTIQRFKKNLLEDEGYLMFTLPVSVKNLILSKYLVSLIFSIISSIVAVLAFMMIALFSGNVLFSDIINIFGQMNIPSDFWKIALFMFVLAIIAYSIFILTIYLSISIGQFPKFNKHRVLAGVVSFFIINTIVSYIQRFISEISTTNSVHLEMSEILTAYDIVSLLLNALVGVVIFIGINWILNKKLNLE